MKLLDEPIAIIGPIDPMPEFMDPIDPIDPAGIIPVIDIDIDPSPEAAGPNPMEEAGPIIIMVPAGAIAPPDINPPIMLPGGIDPGMGCPENPGAIECASPLIAPDKSAALTGAPAGSCVTTD